MLLIMVLLSVCVHLAVGLLIAFLPRALPYEPRSHEQGAIELLMVEQKGTEKNQASESPGDKPVQPVPETAPSAEKETEATAPTAAPAPPLSNDGHQPATPHPEQAPPKSAQADNPPTPEKAAQRPTQPASREAPVFDLAGTESESNAIALGSQILPAMPDNRFRNRPPVYPAEAEMRGQYGSVVVLIHVSENGIATGVDVMESSGVEILDQAAVTAVRKWHFRPAMKAGSAVPFDMPFRFVFEQY